MLESEGSHDLQIYEELSHHDPSDPHVYASTAFARAFADLARRVIAVHSAQNAREVRYPRGLALGGFRFMIGDGDPSALAALPTGDPGSLSPTHLLELAQWLAEGYDPVLPVTGSVQAWAGEHGSDRINLCAAAPRSAPPPPWLVCSNVPPVAGWLKEQPEAPVAIIAHYDTHGISMLSLTLRYLRRLGLQHIDSALSFEWTGDISKLWKRAVIKTLKHPLQYRAVIMVDCSVHSRRPDLTLKALQAVDVDRDQKLIIVDHHSDTFTLAPKMTCPGVEIALTDIFSCGLTDSWLPVEEQLMALGALGDKVPEVFRAYPPSQYPELHEAVAEYGARAFAFSPTPQSYKDAGTYPMAPLWELLAEGKPPTAELAVLTLGAHERPELPPLPKVAVAGAVILATERIPQIGRAWYELLERVMEQEGISYAVAVRLLNGHRANFLLLTDWKALTMPPIRSFVPRAYAGHCLGHPGAVWADIEKSDATDFLTQLVDNLNAYFGIQCDPQEVILELAKNILEPQPVSIGVHEDTVGPLVEPEAEGED